MNSRNFIPEQTLLDRLNADDASAFEEITKRYCYSLYSYSFSKLNSKEDAKRIVRNIFISLWEDRRLLPADFSLSIYLYAGVRKAVVQCLNNKLNSSSDMAAIEEQIIPCFSDTALEKARQPVRHVRLEKSFSQKIVPERRHYEESWWDKYSPSISIKGLKHALQNMVNF